MRKHPKYIGVLPVTFRLILVIGIAQCRKQIEKNETSEGGFEDGFGQKTSVGCARPQITSMEDLKRAL